MFSKEKPDTKTLFNDKWRIFKIKGDDLVIFKELSATVNEFSIETKKTLFFQNMFRSQRTGHPPKNESVSVSSNYPTSLSQTPITSVPRSEHA